LYEEILDLLLNYNAEGEPPQQQKQSSTNSHCSHSNLINIPLLAPATIYSPTNSDTTKPLNITSSQLKIAHLNVRSLRNIAHLTEVKELVNLHGKIDIFTISETWLNSTVTNSEIATEDYKIYRLDRLHKIGGGVCAYIKKNLKASVLKELSQTSESSFNQLWINIQSKKNRSITICVTYRPPDCALNLTIFSDTDVKTQLKTFKNALHSTLDLHAPVKTFKVRSRSNPFISREIKEHNEI
jgi:hypothetical protein